MAVDLKSHPGLNPDYFNKMAIRRNAIAYNQRQRELRLLGKPYMPPVRVPPQPNKYVPHVGAKQRSKTAAWPDGLMDKSAERRK